jgi:Ca2+-binding EF-hand superfamily protein
MRRVLPLAGLLLVPLSLAALSATAQTTDAPRARIQLDANRDGAIDRGEAARHPRLAERFDRLDRDHDGRLERGERGMRHHRGGKRHHGGMARLDTDKDGRISRAEFAVMETRIAEWKARHAERAGKAGAKQPGHRGPLDFAAVDANRDGYLVRAELRAHHERMRPQYEAARKARFDGKFAAADLNKDGKLGRVEAEQAMPRIGDRFNWMDDNRDGFLDRGELSAGRGRRR